jgi:hypothetical protein
MKWIRDTDGDLGLSFWNIVVFIKYKHSVIVEFFKDYPQAEKWT